MNNTIVLLSLLLGLCLVMIIGCDDELSADVPDGTETPVLPCCGLVSDGCPEECEYCCTQVPSNPDGLGFRSYSRFQTDVPGVTAIKANVEHRWPCLCLLSGDNMPPSSIVCAGIALVPPSPANWMWVQAGYAVERYSQDWGERQVYFEIFAEADLEANPPYNQHRIMWWTPDSTDLQPPSEGVIWEYQIYLNDVCNDAYFMVDGTIYWYWESTNWEEWGPGGHVVIAGEVEHNESDMPGTITDSMEFATCMVEVGNDNGFYWLSQISQNDTLICDDWNQWGVYWDSQNSTVRIWDQCPIP